MTFYQSFYKAQVYIGQSSGQAHVILKSKVQELDLELTQDEQRGHKVHKAKVLGPWTDSIY